MSTMEWSTVFVSVFNGFQWQLTIAMHWSNDEMVTIPRWGPVAVEFGCTADNAHSAELQDLQDNNQR